MIPILGLRRSIQGNTGDLHRHDASSPLSQVSDRLENLPEGDPLLLQPDAPASPDKGAKGRQGLLLGRVESGELPLEGGRLLDPELATGEKDSPVHQKGSGLGIAAPETVEDRKSVGIEVSPVEDLRPG